MTIVVQTKQKQIVGQSKDIQTMPMCIKSILYTLLDHNRVIFSIKAPVKPINTPNP